MAFPPVFDAAWDETFPPDTQQANQLGSDIRLFKRDIRERIATLSGTFANRPAPMDLVFGGAGYGITYYATDTGQTFQFTGVAGVWNDISYLKSISLDGGVQVTGARVVSLYANNALAGNVDFLDSSTGAAYVVPAGKSALIQVSSFYNGGGLASAVFGQIKVGGNYYPIGISNNINPGASLQANYNIIALANESISFNSVQAGMNVFASAIEFNSASSLKVGRILNPLIGDNTLYTCPAGKSALLWPHFVPSAIQSSTFTLWAVNSSAGAVNVHFNIVRNGGAPGATNIITPTVTLNASSKLGSICYGGLNAGDFINFNCSAGFANNSIVYAIISEI